jgi:hypothetical protein
VTFAFDFDVPVLDLRTTRGALTTQRMTLDGIATDVTAGAGLETVVLAYLTQIWSKLYVPVQPDDIDFRFGVEGDGEVSVVEAPHGDTCSGALVQIVSVPEDASVYFGDPNVIYAGLCGFTYEQNASFNEQIGETRFIFSLGTGPVRFGRTEWINHPNSIFFPPAPGASGFWYRLKPGFVANLTIYGQQNGFGCRWFTTLNGPLHYRFNPLAGGWNPYDVYSLTQPDSPYPGLGG